MSDKITVRLSPGAEGRRLEWRDEQRGVRVLFLKNGNSLKASLITFDGDKFTAELAERWMANRVAQYCFISQASPLSRYESTLLEAIVASAPKYAKIMDEWKSTPAGGEAAMARHTASLMHKENRVWDLERDLRKKRGK